MKYIWNIIRQTLNWIQSKLLLYDWIIMLLFVFLFLIGIWFGFDGYLNSSYLISNTTTNPVYFTDALYATIKLFTFGDMPRVAPNFHITIARFTLPILISVSVILAYFHFFRGKINLLLTHSYYHHIIICGLGERGYEFLYEKIETGKKCKRDRSSSIIVIEQNKNNPYIKYCENNGIAVLIGDARDPIYLMRAKIQNAQEIFCFLPDDGDNIALINSLVSCLDIKRASQFIPSSRRVKLCCHLSVHDMILYQQLIDRKFIAHATNVTINNKKDWRLLVDIDIATPYGHMTELAIRKGIRSLFQGNGGFHQNTYEKQGHNGYNPPSMVVIGQNNICWEIIKNICAQGHFENSISASINENGIYKSFVPLKIYVIVDKPERKIEFYSRFPMLYESEREKESHDDSLRSQELECIVKSLNKLKDNNLSGETGIKESDVVLPLPEIHFEYYPTYLRYKSPDLAEKILLEWEAISIIVAQDDDTSSIGLALSLEQEINQYFERMEAAEIKKQQVPYPHIAVYFKKNSGYGYLWETNFNSKLRLTDSTDLNHSYYQTLDKPTTLQPLCDWDSSIFCDNNEQYMRERDLISKGIAACYEYWKVMVEKQIGFDYDMMFNLPHSFPDYHNQITPSNTVSHDEITELEWYMKWLLWVDRNWGQWNETKRNQNRYQYYHNRMKLKFLGYKLVSLKKWAENPYLITKKRFYDDWLLLLSLRNNPWCIYKGVDSQIETPPSIWFEKKNSEIFYNSFNNSSMKWDEWNKAWDNLSDLWKEVHLELYNNRLRLAQLDHQRWWAGNLLNGWRYSYGVDKKNQRKSPYKLHRMMKPFPHMKSKDQFLFTRAVMDIETTCKFAGYVPIKLDLKLKNIQNALLIKPRIVILIGREFPFIINCITPFTKYRVSDKESLEIILVTNKSIYKGISELLSKDKPNLNFIDIDEIYGNIAQKIKWNVKQYSRYVTLADNDDKLLPLTKELNRANIQILRIDSFEYYTEYGEEICKIFRKQTNIVDNDKLNTKLIEYILFLFSSLGYNFIKDTSQVSPLDYEDKWDEMVIDIYSQKLKILDKKDNIIDFCKNEMIPYVKTEKEVFELLNHVLKILKNDLHVIPEKNYFIFNE